MNVGQPVRENEENELEEVESKRGGETRTRGEVERGAGVGKRIPCSESSSDIKLE